MLKYPIVNYLFRVELVMAKTAAALHILVKHQDKAYEILKKLEKGENFQKLAKSHSICPSGKKDGGNLGEFRKGAMVPAFDKVCFNAEILTPHLVKTKHGWHIVKILYRT